ncbi:condensation domain-containing protein [Streptomyces sp. NPDC051740]|uniref:condensation domain-containing protein n=1 Tax=Streptomyces sp. NPDC051740 TaxID=3365673 RepID=UPI0037BAA828
MDQCTFEFSGNRSATGPLTWGQQEQWNTIRRIAPEDARFNLPFLWRVSSGFSLPDVVESIRRLVEQHESLRSLITSESEERPSQMVHRTGEATVSLCCVDEDDEPPSLASNWVRELASRRFELSREWPVRFRILMGRANRPLWVCGAVSHIAADATAVTIMERDWNVLLGADKDTVLASHPLQPLERAAYENSQAGKEALDAAVGHWRKTLHDVPRLRFGERRTAEGDIRFPRMTLHSKSLGEIARRVASDLGVWESAVLMSSAARAFLEMTGDNAFPMIVTCSNRLGGTAHDYVGTIAQQGIAPMAGDVEFAHTVRRLWASLIRMPRHSMYDPAPVAEIVDQSSGGEFFWLDHFVNHLSLPLTEDAAKASEGADGRRGFLTEGKVESSFLRFGLMLRTYGPDAQFKLFADNRYIGRESMRAALIRMDDLIREQGARR